MKAKEQLAEFKQILDIELKKYLDQKVVESGEISEYAKVLMEHIHDLTLRGGKRIRAALLYYSYIAHGGKNKTQALYAAMSMEMAETYLLIHDDIMDDDSLRRGGITIHESYKMMAEERFPAKINARHFGISAAILAGNIACALSNEIIACAKLDSKIKCDALCELNKIYTIENIGQMLDIFSELRDNVTKKDILQIQELKTVPYTFDGPIKIGAILAGANTKAVKKLEKYSYPLGTAFQIQDDILGMFGSEERLGKPVTSDLKEGKKTLLILDALEKAKAEQKEIILLNLGNKRVSTRGLRAVRRVIEETGALEKSKKMAEDLVIQSTDAIKAMKLVSIGKDFLLNIAEYMIKRDY